MRLGTGALRHLGLGEDIAEAGSAIGWRSSWDESKRELGFSGDGSMLGRRRIPVLLISATMLLTVGVVFVRRSQQPLESKPLPAAIVTRHADEKQQVASRIVATIQAQTELLAELGSAETEGVAGVEDREKQMQTATSAVNEARQAQKRLERKQQEEATAWRRAETASERTRGLVTLALGGVVVLMTVVEVRRRRGLAQN